MPLKLHNLCMGCMEDRGPVEKCPTCGFIEASGQKSPNYLRPRTLLQDKYLIGNVLGQGGFAITYLAWDINLGIKLAIKEYFPLGLVCRNPENDLVVAYSKAQDNIFAHDMEKFLQEARILARFMDHPNIVSVTDFFRANRTAYLVMHYIEGVTLRHYLNRIGGKLPFDIAMEVIMPVMDALRVIHEAGLLHRDVSPENIIISQSGRVMLIDFGAAKHSLGAKDESMSVVMKPGYTPEEQYRSQGVQDPRTDLYAVAATIYRSITGQLPPNALDRLDYDTLIFPSQLGALINPEQEQALIKALSVFAENRFYTIGEFQESLISSPALSPDLEKEAPVTGSKPEIAAVERAAPPLSETFPDTDSTDSGDIKIGRASDNDLILEDITVSRHHTRIFLRYGKWHVADLDSTCGTFLNEVRVEEPVELTLPARIRLSDKDLYFDGESISDQEGEVLFAIEKKHSTSGPWQRSFFASFSNLKGKIQTFTGRYTQGLTPGKPPLVVNIGRSPGNDLVLRQETVSRHHLRLFNEGGKWLLTDLQSTHGTKVNRKPVEGVVELSPGDTILVSDVNLHFNGESIISDDQDILYNLPPPGPISNREDGNLALQVKKRLQSFGSVNLWILLAAVGVLIIVLVLILLL